VAVEENIFDTQKLGGALAQQIEHWTCDQQVVGSNTTWGKAA